VNWLAHLALAPPTPAGWLGALAGDVVKGPLPGNLDPALAASVALHRRIDASTDRHPAFARSRRRLEPRHRHWRGVLVDVFYDHVLASRWSEFAPGALESFVARVHAALDGILPQMPAGLRAFSPRLRDEGWLVSYREPGGIGTALRRMRRRLRRDHPLDEALPELLADVAGFAADLHWLWPALRAVADGAPRPGGG
jgi:acyl carrier protein phosphodiesterase